MIRYLRMENFRRHAGTELRFDESGQIVLINGSNGAGKSSVIEAIVYALYGEGRTGNRHLERLVRRGAELEGMEVELEFEVADELYRVKRRRDNKVSSAVLWGNDVALMEGPREVSAAVAGLLGMDARGFRLAVVAQQKELDGLASMRPAERGAMLSRLLRLDAITQARDLARGRFRSERDALRGLGSVESVDGLVDQIAGLRGEIEDDEKACLETEAAVVTIDAELAAGGAIESAWVAASTNAARCGALVGSAREERKRIENELAELVVEPVDASGVDLAALEQAGTALDRRLAKAEADKALVAQAAMLRGELERAGERIVQIEGELAGLPENRAVAEAGLQAAKDSFEEARLALAETKETGARQRGLVDSAKGAAEAAAEIGAMCATCGQEVSDEQRDHQHRSAQEQLEALESGLEGLRETAREQNRQLAELGEMVKGTEALVEAARHAERLRAELVELERRVTTYRGQLERVEVDGEDVEELYEKRGRLETEIAEARDLVERATLATLAAERHADVESKLQAAEIRVEQAASLAEQARIDTDLDAAYQRLAALRDGRAVEAELLSRLRSSLATKNERLAATERELVRVEKLTERRRGLETSAAVASQCAEVLDRVSSTLSQQIRPALEGGIAEVLARMSDGRFDAVSLDEDYTLSVRDDGAMRPLSEFSGGEIDLIALAVRLALAGVVAERHGSGGVGFLILDECFGSQDQDRRGSIMTALRSLRGAYGQILLISHVGGIEDAADVVVNIEVDEETGISSASSD